jgi:hypothetical protein
VWWNTSVIPVLGRLTQKNLKLKASLSSTERPCLKTTTKHKVNTCNNADKSQKHYKKINTKESIFCDSISVKL